MSQTENKKSTSSCKNSWICDHEKTLLSSSFMELIERQCHSSEEASKTFKFYFLKSKDWCNIIPITEDGKVVLVKQFRIGISEHTLEIPGGVVDPEDKDHQAAAIREMEEETGYAPMEGAQCQEIGWVYPNPAIMDNRCHSYVIGPVKKVTQQNLDAGEMIEVIEVPLSEIPARIISGEIRHALMLNTFFFLTLQSEKGSRALLDSLNNFTRIDRTAKD